MTDCTHDSSAAARMNMLRIFRKRLAIGQSLMVTDVSKLGYTSVIFIDSGVKIDGTYLASLSTVVGACQVSGSSYFSMTVAYRTGAR